MPIYHVEVERRYQVLIEAKDGDEAERNAPDNTNDLDPDVEAWVRCRVECAKDLKASGWDEGDTPFKSDLTLREIFAVIEAEREAATPPRCTLTPDLFAAGTDADSQPALGPSETRTAP